MPLVHISLPASYRDGYDAFYDGLNESLPPVAAKALSTIDGGRLKPGEIMIAYSWRSKYDKNARDVEVRVYAHDYPERRKTKDAARDAIEAELVKHLTVSGTTYNTWVLLCDTSYSEGVIK